MIYINKRKLILRKKEIYDYSCWRCQQPHGRDKSDLTIDGKTFLEMQIEKGKSLESVIFFCLAIMVK